MLNIKGEGKMIIIWMCNNFLPGKYKRINQETTPNDKTLVS